MVQLTVQEKLSIFSRYIGQQVIIERSLTEYYIETGILKGVKHDAVCVDQEGVSRWIPLSDKISLCKIKLLLKPLKMLTPDIISTANSLPVQAFITPYYQSLGFDMPVYLSPGHPCNCQYVQEVGLADYRSANEIININNHQLAVC
jgi:hypothetical protein